MILGAPLLILLGLVLTGEVARAEPAAAPSAPSASDDGAPRKKSKFQRSKLTNDESEMTADRRVLRLTTGEDRAVDLDFEANGNSNGIAVGNLGVVATTLVKIGEKRQIVFKPLKGGETTVTVRDADGTIRLVFEVIVGGSNLLRRAAEVRDLLRDIEGIDIRIVGQKVIVDGEVLVPADYARLLNVVTDKAYGDLVLNLSTLSPLAMQVLSKRIQDDINSFAPNVKTRVVNGMIFLEGTVDNREMGLRAAEVAKLYLPDVKPGNPIQVKDPSAQILPPRSLIQNFLVVNPPPPKKNEKLVRVTVHFVELSKDYNKTFGFKWEPGFTADPQISVGAGAGQDAAGGGGATFTGTISSLLPKLQSAQQAGYARILKTGTVITRSGQPGTLDESTEFPFTVTGANGAVQGAKQQVGLKIAVTPLILGQSEDIQLDLNLNQINLVGRATAGSAPIVANHAVTTKLYVKSNESAAVAGVMSSEVGTDFNKDDPNPGAFEGNTSPLFTLLHSKAYRKKKSQFVIFVTPQVVENASEGTDDLKKNFRVKVK